MYRTEGHSVYSMHIIEDMRHYMRHYYAYTIAMYTIQNRIYVKQKLIYLPRAKFINPLTAKLFNLNFHPLEVLSRSTTLGE